MAITSMISAGTTMAQPRSVLAMAFARFRAWRAEWREIDQITAELSAYSDSGLAELGIKRSDIPDVARGRYGRA